MNTTPLYRPFLLLCATLCAGWPVAAQNPVSAPVATPTPVQAPQPVLPPPPADAPAPPLLAELPWEVPALQPFTATYQALYKGREAGDATMTVTHVHDRQWRIDMQVTGRRGFASVLGLNLEQSTVFENRDGQYVPLSQSTVRKGLFLGKKVTGTYNWAAGIARWEGDLKKKRRQPITLQPGDLSALLINLAIMRDARPGASMHYRYVDVGRVRQHDYQAAASTESIAVDDLGYDALRVSRTNGGNDETILWIANGVPTPVRILQREDGEDRIDLRLIEYQGVQ